MGDLSSVTKGCGCNRGVRRSRSLGGAYICISTATITFSCSELCSRILYMGFGGLVLGGVHAGAKVKVCRVTQRGGGKEKT